MRFGGRDLARKAHQARFDSVASFDRRIKPRAKEGRDGCVAAEFGLLDEIETVFDNGVVSAARRETERRPRREGFASCEEIAQAF
jgi:hypothetical protein